MKDTEKLFTRETQCIADHDIAKMQIGLTYYGKNNSRLVHGLATFILYLSYYDHKIKRNLSLKLHILHSFDHMIVPRSEKVFPEMHIELRRQSRSYIAMNSFRV